jgi:cytoskeletal protein CcmA (bactofilin family)
VINGDLTGEEDLVIEGRVQGEVRLTKNSVTVGKQGQIRADIRGLRIHVEGEVRGNLYGEEEVVIRASGRVQGNIVAPRVTLENGSKFKGAIDMEPATARSTTPPAEPKKATSAASAPSGPSKAATSPASASSSKPS